MEQFKKEKRKSFWGGILAGTAVSGILFAIVTIMIILSQAKYYKAHAAQFVSSDGTGAIVDSNVAGKIDQIYAYIDNYFYFEDDVDVSKMREDIYAAVLNSMEDPYTVYYTREELSALFEESEGVYFGVGSYVTMDSERNLPMFSGVFEQSPAQKAGIRDGDFVYAVDGVEVSGMTLTEVTNLIKGPIDTEVTITVIRDGEKDYLDFVVTRGKIETPTVNYEMMDGNIGYLQITEFDEVTLNQFKEAYDDLKAQGMEALILDLRSNPGGNLDVVVGICEYILPEGVITYTVDKYGNREDYMGKGKAPIDIPLAVLVNEYSASASELMTGAIRDYGVGTIVGKNTFGKGIVQQIFSLGDGTGLKITTSSYYTPNGECIHKTGIAPDIEVELDTDLYYSDEKIDTQLNAAVECINEKLGR